jgi:hypothetical protein
MQAHSGAMEAHSGAIEAHPAAIGAHPGATDAQLEPWGSLGGSPLVVGSPFNIQARDVHEHVTFMLMFILSFMFTSCML